VGAASDVVGGYAPAAGLAAEGAASGDRARAGALTGTALKSGLIGGGTAPVAVPTGGVIEVEVTVRNVGARAGAEVVQLYGRDPVASVTRPVRQLLAYQRVELAAGEARRLVFEVPTARFAFLNRQMTRVVEPGEVLIWFGTNCENGITEEVALELTGAPHQVTTTTPRQAKVQVLPA
jgi:beta-glucosidase